MEYFSILFLVVSFIAVIFYLQTKSKNGGAPIYTEDEAAREINSRITWIERYKSLPDEKKTEQMKQQYRSKYVELKQIQLSEQKFTAIRKDIKISDETRASLEEYFPIAQKEIDLVKSGVNPEEARKIAYKGTKYEAYSDIS